MDLFKSLFDAIGGAKRGSEAKAAARIAEEEAEKKRLNANWDPEYEADIAPAYQRETSPLARSYLESFLSGTNADAIQGTRLGADDQKLAAAKNFTADTGGFSNLREQQRLIEQDDERFRSRKPSGVKTEFQ